MSRSQGRQNQTKKYADQSRRIRSYVEYIDGNTVRKIDLDEIPERDYRKKQNHAARKNREKAVHMNLKYVLFLTSVLMVAGVVLIGYINLRAEITSSINRISQMESELYNLKQKNDEYETRINSSVDLEEVRRIAIEELGMKYASEGQIVNVEAGSDDYVRKYADIP